MCHRLRILWWLKVLKSCRAVSEVIYILNCENTTLKENVILANTSRNSPVLSIRGATSGADAERVKLHSGHKLLYTHSLRVPS